MDLTLQSKLRVTGRKEAKSSGLDGMTTVPSLGYLVFGPLIHMRGHKIHFSDSELDQ